MQSCLKPTTSVLTNPYETKTYYTSIIFFSEFKKVNDLIDKNKECDIK